MDATTWLLLPDAREEEPTIQALNERIKQMRESRLKGGVMYPFHLMSFALHYPPAWTTRSEEIDPHMVLQCFREVDWEYPVLVTWRSSQENQWNFSRMGLSPATLSGEGEEGST